MQHPHEMHTALPMMEFLHMLAGPSHETTRTLLDAGVLDVLVGMRICDNPLFHRLGNLNKESGASLQRAYSSLMHILEPRFSGVIVYHPVFAIWPKAESMDLNNNLMLYTSQRNSAWRTLGRDLVFVRLRAVQTVLQEISIHTRSDQANVCIDLIEFLR